MNQNDNVFNNPQFLAGLAMIRGVPAHEAYVNAAQQVQQMQKAQMEQQAFQRQQYAMQALPQIAQKLYNSPPQEAFQELVNIGIEPKEALVLLDAIQKQSTPDTFKGPGDVQYMKSFNRELGEWEAKPIMGQQALKPQLANSEIKINADQINTLNKDASHASEEIRLIENSEKAFEDFDKNVWEYTGAGTLVNKLLPEKAENILYNKDAQTAQQTIRKLTSGLLKNRQEAAKGAGSDFRTDQILKGLPSTQLTPEARKELIKELKEQNYRRVLKAKFFDDWYKQNNKDLNGAENAFNNFIEGKTIVNQNGNLNKNLLNEIPQAIEDKSYVIDKMDTDGEFGNMTTEQLLAIARGK